MPGFIGFMCFVGWFYKRFYDGFMVLCRGSQLRIINKQSARRTTSWSNVRRAEELYKFLNHAGASLIATGLAASTLDPLFQNQTELHKSEFDSLPRHHPSRKSDAKEGLITSSCRPETVGPTSDFSRTVTPCVCETLKPVCVTLWALPKTNKTIIKPSIKPVHKMHKTVKTGRRLKET